MKWANDLHHIKVWWWIEQFLQLGSNAILQAVKHSADQLFLESIYHRKMFSDLLPRQNSSPIYNYRTTSCIVRGILYDFGPLNKGGSIIQEGRILLTCNYTKTSAVLQSMSCQYKVEKLSKENANTKLCLSKLAVILSVKLSDQCISTIRYCSQ